MIQRKMPTITEMLILVNMPLTNYYISITYENEMSDFARHIN